MRAFVIVVLFFIACRSSQAIDIVRDGKPIATIVASYPVAQAGSSAHIGKGSKQKAVVSDEDFAVRTLIEWVKKITDAELLASQRSTLLTSQACCGEIPKGHLGILDSGRHGTFGLLQLHVQLG